MDSPVACCGRPLEVIRLSGGSDPAVEMLRCRTCARSSWRSGDRVLPRADALAALAEVHRATTPRRPRTVAPRPARTAPKPRPVRPFRAEPELADLLPGWRVLGS